MVQPAHEAPFTNAAIVGLDAAPTGPELLLVGSDDTELDIELRVMDLALEGLDYDTIRDGFLPTSPLSCEEEHIAAGGLGLRFRIPVKGRKQIR